MGAKELASLYDSLESQQHDPKGDDGRRREFVRWPFRAASVELRLYQPGNSVASEIRVACRDLSCGGMSVVHSAYMHTGSKVVLRLPRPDGELIEVSGFVSRCRHVRGVIHEIGIRFDRPIHARDFVRLDPFSDCFSLESVKAEELKGHLLYVDDSPIDQKLVKHYLRETGLRLTLCDDPAKAIAVAGEGCDLILTDHDMPGMTGAELVTKLREEGINTPVILVTSDTSAATRATLQAARVNAFLTKPLRPDVLLRAVAEFMVVGATTSAMHSSLPKTDPNYPLVEGFVAQARQYVKRLNDAIERDDAATARSIALQIKGVAPALGFEAIALLASEAVKSLSASMSVAESIRPMRMLIAACERARS